MSGERRRSRGDVRLRPLDLPSPVLVRTDRAGRPVAILKSPAPCGIAAIREVWRIDDEWWRNPVSRLYHDVVLENGKVLTLYRDLISGGWWRQ